MATSPYASPLTAPTFRAFTLGGLPLGGGTVEAYAAGTNNPLPMYPTYTDALAGTNPLGTSVSLDTNGEKQIFVQALFYKIVVKDSAGVVQHTTDFVAPAIGYPGGFLNQWITDLNAVSFQSSVSFTLAGDQTAFYPQGQRVRTSNTGGTVYSTVSTSSFGAGITTIVVVNDSGSIDSGISAVAYGVISATNQSYLSPLSVTSLTKNGTQSGFAASTKIANWTTVVDKFTEYDAGNNRITIKNRGTYRFECGVELLDTAAGVDVTMALFKNAVNIGQARGRTWSTANQITSLFAHAVIDMATNDYFEVFLLGSAATVVQGTTGTHQTMTKIR